MLTDIIKMEITNSCFWKVKKKESICSGLSQHMETFHLTKSKIQEKQLIRLSGGTLFIKMSCLSISLPERVVLHGCDQPSNGDL